MKKSVLIMITLLLVVAIAGVVVYAIGGDKNKNEHVSATSVDEEVEKENADPETAPAEPDAVNEPEPVPVEPAVVSLEEYWEKLKARIDADIDVCSIYQGAVELLSFGKPVVFGNNKYVSYFYTLCPGFYSKDPRELFAAKITVEGDITTVYVDPDTMTEYDVYMVFLASLSNCFPEYLYDRDESNGDSFSGTSNTRLFFASDIESIGYEDVKSYYLAVMDGKVGYTDKSYSINYKVPRIAKCVDTPGRMQNIYEEIRDNYFNQGQ